MKAADIAARAHDQAIEAAEAEQRERDAEQARIAREKHERQKATYESALPTLSEWFPGVEWDYTIMGDYATDVVLFDAAESWPPSFLLKVTRTLIDMNAPGAGYRTKIEVGDYVTDTSMPGYSYFRGGPVKSAADVGRYLASKK
jgi:hypothetical protein